MAPRNNELPEGTDHIVNGAMETGAGSRAGATGTTPGAGNAGSGFIGTGAGDGTGGTAAGGGTMATNTTGTGNADTGTTGTGTTGTTSAGGGTLGSGTRSGGSDTGGGVVDQLRSQATQLRDQAGGRAREFAESGKTRASDALEELSRTIGETAESIDDRLGNEYGEYARRAADAVSGVADTLRRQDVDALYENVRSAVRKSPGVAIGVAAVLGFTVARLIKAGLPGDEDDGGTRTNSAPGGSTGGSTGGTAIGGTGGSSGTTATGTGGTASTRS